AWRARAGAPAGRAIQPPKANACYSTKTVPDTFLTPNSPNLGVNREMQTHSKFWLLSYPKNSPALVWDNAAEFYATKKASCSADPRHHVPSARVVEPHLLLPDKELQDLVWTWHNDCLVQDHVLQNLLAEGFTGFQPRPVHLRRESPSTLPLPKLWKLHTSGWGGLAQPESGIRLEEYCAACGRQLYTGLDHPELLIDEQQWDGSDFFMVWPMPLFVFITDRVSHFIRRNKLSGAKIIDPAELELSIRSG